MVNISNKYSWLYQQFQLQPDKIFLNNETQKYSFKEIYELLLSNNALFERQNQVCALYADTSVNFILTILGLWHHKKTVVLINRNLTQEEILSQVTNIGTKEILDPETIKFTRSKVFEFTAKHSPTDNALILFTSGSTGKPKAVLHTFESLFQGVLNSDSFINHKPDDNWLASLPLYHIGGIMIFIRALICGTQLTIPNSLSTNDIINSIKVHDPNILSFVPTMFNRIKEQLYYYKTNIKILFIGGGPLNHHQICEDIKNGWPIAKVYGASETAAMVTAISSEEIEVNPESCGKPLGDVHIDFDSESNIIIKSRSLFKGYLTGSKIDNSKIVDGFYNTGDIGEISGSNLIIYSRRDDLIVSGGKNVDPLEIENAITKLVKDSEVVVLGIDNSEWGQMVVAVIKTEDNFLTQNHIQKALREKLSGYKIPKIIKFIKELPINSIGKIDKQNLKKLFN